MKTPDDLPQRWTELRARHVLPCLGCCAVGFVTVAFAGHASELSGRFQPEAGGPAA
jgi:hypothetical protein